MGRFSLTLMLVLLPYLMSAQDDCVGRLQTHVKTLSDPKMKGRGAGTDGERMAAEYMYDYLYDNGVTMLSGRECQIFSINGQKDTVVSRNVVGIVEGYDPAYRGEYIVVGANLDHLGANKITVNGKEGIQIYPGANDNASGLACVMELARKIAATNFLFKRSVVFAGFGAKERGMAGSWYMINKGFIGADSVSLMVDMSRLGHSGPSFPFRYFTCIPNPEIAYTVGVVGRNMSLNPPTPGTGQTYPSDYLAFYELGIPVTIFTSGSENEFRSSYDVAESLDYDQMEFAVEFVFNFLREIANADKKVARVSLPKNDTDDPSDRVYSVYEVEKAPQFYHGDEKQFLKQWVYTYVKYPQSAMELGIQGRVIVDFIVEKDGSVSNVRVNKGVDDELDAEAVKVVAASPKWKAGVLGGQKVRVKYSIPIEFKLRKDAKYGLRL
ncbi:MAG: TonB family protein [Bacteroidales bacterium]|nr:TonB family protein [Bacteroidales bacterium]